MHPPSHRHRTVHLRPAFPHLQFPLQAFSQLQWNSSEHALPTSSRIVHLGFHTLVWSFRTQSHSEGSGMFRSRPRACLQTYPAWCSARLVCCRRASWVGGIFSSVHLLCEKSCLLASFTREQSNLLLYMMTVQRSSRSM